MKDLSALSITVATTSAAGQRFRAAVRAALGAQAEFNDLERCLWTVAVIADLDMQAAERSLATGTTEQDNVDGLLATSAYLSAIILYVRATERRSNHKPKPDYERVYSPEQLKTHEMLLDLRDDALAHWGPGGPDPLGRVHHNIKVVLHDDGRVGCLSKHANYIGSVVAGLNELASLALKVADEKADSALQRVAECLVELSAHNPAVAIPDFDAEEFFGGRPSDSFNDLKTYRVDGTAP